MTDSALKQSAIGFYDAFNDRNIEELERVLQPDWIIHPELAGEGSNVQKYKAIAAALLAAFPDVHFSVEEAIAENNTVAVRAVISGTHAGTWLGVAPSRQRIQIFAHDFHRIRAGKIAESWHVEDWLLGIGQMKATE